ncbi:hypothetical protein CFR76_07610 [Komagataeibacter swingsii]|uniref:Uncharacterized protein n=2 Tax=Komagataeibacter swingsii TaxID=215220 RepID=A0A2V4R5A3_9PROT|nr:hypothetical protein CFR76_07610 [Komagataeibacter swingsii]GBQ61174.1 hypothetical protein AA16373_2121 [Komagataeibacter swingsii DSM 16373]
MGLPLFNLRHPVPCLFSLLALLAAAPARAAPDTALGRELAAATGHYAPETDLFGQGPLATIVKRKLGAQYDSFIQNMEVAGPLEAAGDVLFITGNRRHEGGSRNAWLLIDRAGRNMTIGLLNPGALSLYTTGPVPLAKPADVRTLIENLDAAPPFCNQPQDLPPGGRLDWQGTLEAGGTCVYRIGLHQGEQVTARLDAPGNGLELRVIDPHQGHGGVTRSWTVPRDDLYLVSVAPRPGAPARERHAYRLRIDTHS